MWRNDSYRVEPKRKPLFLLSPTHAAAAGSQVVQPLSVLVVGAALLVSSLPWSAEFPPPLRRRGLAVQLAGLSYQSTSDLKTYSSARSRGKLARYVGEQLAFLAVKAPRELLGISQQLRSLRVLS